MLFAALLLAFAGSADPIPSGAGDAQDAASPKTQQVSVTARFEVSDLGTVDKCEVVTTDAPAKLAEGVCPLFTSKAKFKPMLDEKGNPQRQTLTRTVKFVIQD